MMAIQPTGTRLRFVLNKTTEVFILMSLGLQHCTKLLCFAELLLLHHKIVSVGVRCLSQQSSVRSKLISAPVCFCFICIMTLKITWYAKLVDFASHYVSKMHICKEHACIWGYLSHTVSVHWKHDGITKNCWNSVVFMERNALLTTCVILPGTGQIGSCSGIWTNCLTLLISPELCCPFCMWIYVYTRIFHDKKV